jgi:hypothetical protein
MTVERCVVNNRVFLLGLDGLYREAMKRHERDELLTCAQHVASVLSVSPADVPVEGYYSEDDQLTKYFLLVRALQEVHESRAADVNDSRQFQRLKQVTGSRIFGQPPETSETLLPMGRDPLSIALEETAPYWSIENLTSTAYRTTVESDDFSLVGLASLSKDPVVIAALRESVVLYARRTTYMSPERERDFIWEVDDSLSQRAQCFIRAFNELFDEDIPDATADSAEAYWYACDEAKTIGRCVGIGCDETRITDQHYHWAIDVGDNGELIVKDFWHNDVWTTTRYREQLDARVVRRY